MIENPILKGFNPDPSIIRVGEDYYIATSTFEWFPGVRIYHSKNLKDWELLGYPLDTVDKLDLRGVGISQGIWAPCLTYDNGTFYLVYTIVKAFYCNMYDTENYLIKSDSINGPWSQPISLNNYGFDPSLFHDTDGKKFIVSMVTDHRVPKKYKGRIVLQEYDDKEEKMVGNAIDIFNANNIFLEGPHIYKRNGYYYLFCADTGTGEGHGQSILRSRNITGPYEMKMDRPLGWEENDAFSIMTSRHNENLLLQKSGHGDLVSTPDGDWYMVHLCGRGSDFYNSLDARKFPGAKRYMIGRETAIQKVYWKNDDWLELENGTWPEVNIKEAVVSDWIPKKKIQFDNFDEEELDKEYQSLRIPMTSEYISLSMRNGWLRMYGRSGLASRFSQSLIAKRMTSYSMEASTCIDYTPEVFKQMAGLIFMYDTENYLYLHVTYDEEIGKCITLLKNENNQVEYLADYIPLKPNVNIRLKLTLDHGWAQFYYSEADSYKKIGELINASFLSDEACQHGWFTGAMIGICAQDLTGMRKYCDFDYFELKNI